MRSVEEGRDNVIPNRTLFMGCSQRHRVEALLLSSEPRSLPPFFFSSSHVPSPHWKSLFVSSPNAGFALRKHKLTLFKIQHPTDQL